MEYKFDNITLLDKIKTLCAYRGISLRKLLNRLSEQNTFTNCYSSFYNKLKNSTLKYAEMEQIAKALGYEIIFKDIN